MRQAASLFKQYLDCSANRPNTLESKSRAFRFFLDRFGDMDITLVRYGHGEDYRNLITRRGVNPKTVNLYVGHLYNFFAWAVKREYVRINPLLELKRLPTTDKPTKPFKKSEIARMVNVSGIYFQVMILLGYCGMRKSEVLHLTKKELNYEKGFIELVPKKETASTFGWGIKNRKLSYVPFPQYIRLDRVYDLHHLTRLLSQLTPDSQPYLNLPKKRYQYLLERRRNGLFGITQRNDLWGNFDRKFKYISRQASVRLSNFHGLRVSFIQKLRDDKLDLRQAQIAARHESINTTARYYAYEDERELVASLAENF
ncbi:MAG: tyrosine-type recombinase/integrase [Planctomycetota bacterium]|jgi:integrase